MPVICTSVMTHLGNFWPNQHARLRYITIGDFWNDIHYTPKKNSSILIQLVQCPPHGAKNTEEAWHNVVGKLLSPLGNLDLWGANLKWDFPDGFQRQCYPWLAAWVGDCPEQVMLAQVSYSSWLKCVISNSVLMGHLSLCQQITQEIRKFSLSVWGKLIWMLCKLFVFTQSPTSFGNTLSAMCISSGSILNFSCCFWIWLKTYWTGCWHSWKPQMSAINLTVDWY